MTALHSEEDTRSLLAVNLESEARPRSVALWPGGSSWVPLAGAGTLLVGRSGQLVLSGASEDASCWAGESISGGKWQLA